MVWDPDTYLAFAGPRLRPALDLVERIPLPPEEVQHVVDLGAGPGQLSSLLHDRFPRARLTLVDNDASMLARAIESVAGPRITVVEADVATWVATDAVDVLFSNSALHWLDHHETLLPRLLSLVRPGGAFAVQMPRNHDEPSHQSLARVVRDGPWRERLQPIVRPNPVRQARDYHRILSPHADHLDVWSTTYVQRLPAPADARHPVLAWMRGSTLRPVLAELGEDTPDGKAFEAALSEHLADDYPIERDGSALFPFTRVFLVATPAATAATSS